MPAHILVNLRAFQLFSALVGSVRKYYATDGTAAGTVLLQTINGGSTVRPPGELGTVNGHAIYFADNGNGYTVYSTDGTVTGTVTLVSAIGDPAHVADIGSTGSRDLFTTLVGSVRRTYSTDGTAAGTVLLQTINGAAPLRPGGDLGTINGHGIYFADNGNGNGYTVYSTDGTVAGTVTLVSAAGDPAHVADIGSTGSLDLFTTLVGSVRRTYSTDGTAAGTVLLQTINGAAPLRPGGNLGTINGHGIYFADNGNGNGYTVYSTNGTVAGTVTLVSAAGDPANVVDIGSTGSLDLFSTLVGSTRRYYSTDGTAAGTVLLLTINGASTARPPGDLGMIDGHGIFFADNGNGYTVYSTNGTVAGTVVLVSVIGDPAHVADIGSTGSLDLFTTLVGSVRRTYSTDGTAAGTVLLQTINGAAPLRPGGDLGTLFGHGMYFADNGNGYTVYSTDGSVAGTSTLLSAMGDPAYVDGLGGVTHTSSSTAASVNVDENEPVAGDIDTAKTYPGLIFLIQGGADAARFSINATTGILTFLTAPNYEAPADTNHDNVYEVIVRASAGGATSDQALTIRVVNVVESANEGNFILGTAGNDVINASATPSGQPFVTTRDDVIFGDGGADTLDGGVGNDSMNGGPGNDFMFVDSPGDIVLEAVGEGSDRVLSSVSYNLAAGVSIEILSTTDQALTTAINFTGNDLAQSIVGNAGANTLDGGGGGDTMIGLGGDDFYVVRAAGDRAVEAAGGGSDRVFAAVSFTLEAGSSVEMITTIDNAATAAMNLTGNALSQAIFGNAGSNMLDGGGGGDTMVGFGGDDFYIVRSGADRAVEAAAGGSDRVFAAASFALEAGSEVEILCTADQAASTALNLTGNALTQSVVGNAGANTLDSGGGNDVLVGLGGDDFYFVRAAGDRAVEAAGGGNDRVFAAVSFGLEAGSSIETLSTIFNGDTTAINLTGNDLAQTLFGNDGANILDGKGGLDTLTGFGGADIFTFTTALGAGNIDQIADFVSGTDRIAIDDAIFTGLATGALPATAFVIGTAAGDADDRIIYDNATGALFFDADGNGAGAAVQFATLSGAPALAAADFAVI